MIENAKIQEVRYRDVYRASLLLTGKESAHQGRRRRFDPWVGKIPGLGRSLEEETATHSSILAWRIPPTEEPDGLQSTESQRVGHD